MSNKLIDTLRTSIATFPQETALDGWTLAVHDGQFVLALPGDMNLYIGPQAQAPCASTSSDLLEATTVAENHLALALACERLRAISTDREVQNAALDAGIVAMKAFMEVVKIIQSMRQAKVAAA